MKKISYKEIMKNKRLDDFEDEIIEDEQEKRR